MADSGEERGAATPRRRIRPNPKALRPYLRGAGSVGRVVLVQSGKAGRQLTWGVAVFLLNFFEETRQRRRIRRAGGYLSEGNKLVEGDPGLAKVEYDKSIDLYTQSLSYNPRLTMQLAEAYHRRGIVEDRLQNRQQAIEDYNEALRRDPQRAGFLDLAHGS